MVTSAIFVVALLYSMVGHGGASGYLAILAMTGVSHTQMSSTALVLNMIVAVTGTIMYARAGHLNMRKALPFIVTSVPAALLGGYLHIPEKIYDVILTLVLTYSAFRLGINTKNILAVENTTMPSNAVASSVGAGLGLLSGVVGIGGGIFLSPIMLLKRWTKPQETSAIAALFIVVNSAAGICGRLLGGQFTVASSIPWLVAAAAGGLIGSHMGASTMSREAICRVLAAVLMIAVCKMAMVIVS